MEINKMSFNYDALRELVRRTPKFQRDPVKSIVEKIEELRGPAILFGIDRYSLKGWLDPKETLPSSISDYQIDILCVLADHLGHSDLEFYVRPEKGTSMKSLKRR